MMDPQQQEWPVEERGGMDTSKVERIELDVGDGASSPPSAAGTAAASSPSSSSVDTAPPGQHPQQQQQLEVVATTGSTPSSPGPAAGPSKRESLRSLAVGPLIRRASQNVRDAAAAPPWAVALNSTRARAEKEKRQWDVGVAKFNQKPAQGIEYLVNNGLLARTPEAVAGFIRERAELSKRRVGEFLGSPDPFAQAVLEALLLDYDFEGLALDEAMRLLINDIRFPGESQQIDRILQRFASRFFACNCRQPPQPQPLSSASSSSAAGGGVSSSPSLLSSSTAHFATEDVVYILSFSLLLLNTDLHNRSLRPGDKMTLEAFIRNNRGINGGKDLPRELLAGLYGAVKRREMRMREGDMYDKPALLPFVSPRLSGWLAKQSTGAIARWKIHWFVLSGGVLYYFPSPQASDPRCMILLESVTAIKGPSPTGTEVLLYSHHGGLIKSAKIRRSNRSMVQGTRTRYLLRASSREERDEWLVALQQETPALLRGQHRATHTGTTGAATTAHTTTHTTVRSPHSAPGLLLGSGGGGPSSSTAAYRCLMEGWMRRRSDVSRSWQRRFFMLLSRDPPVSSSSSSSSLGRRGSGDKAHGGPRVELLYFTTQEMGQRMLELGLTTAQGGVPMQEGTVVLVKPADAVPYRAPEPGAVVWEVEAGGRGVKAHQRVREVVSPEEGGGEEDTGHEQWLQALQEHCPAVAVRTY